jgi:aspartate/glutamate racemase
MKTKRIRDSRFNAKRIYAVSGIMKCALCGTNYSGDRGVYRCNSTSKPGDKCLNNDISQQKVEDAVFAVIDQQVLNFRNVKGFIDRVKERFKSDNSEGISI